MAKKMDEAEVKKECPSCGLGVALDATICEFCGWDFEEEDEWILQIEKLERDLMLEKQKFAPGTVNEKIESTLHTPAIERIEAIKAKQKDVTLVKPSPEPAKAVPAPKPPPVAAPASREPEAAKVRRVRSVKTAPTVEEPVAPPARPATSGPAPSPAAATKKVRVVRKVKQA